jgi:DNA adenine methylase
MKNQKKTLIKTPIRYAGGKSKALKIITPFFEKDRKIVSPFIGGGSLEVHLASLGKEVIGYDLFSALSNFWNVLLNKPNELADKMKEIRPNRDEFDRVKEILIKWDDTQSMLKGWKTDHYRRDEIITLDEVTAAAFYYFNHNTSYGPGYLGWPSDVYLNEVKWNKMIQTILNFRLPNLKVFQNSFENVIPKHKNDTLYLDPPYFLEKDKDNKMFKGIYPMRNIPVHHDNFNHELLRDLLIEHKGNFVLSYNNCETIREFYKDFEQQFPTWNYSMGNGETRVGKNRTETGGSITKESHEILIIKR